MRFSFCARIRGELRPQVAAVTQFTATTPSVQAPRPALVPTNSRASIDSNAIARPPSKSRTATMLRPLASLFLLASAATAASDGVLLHCFGDGSGAPCPCDNHGAPGAGCVNVSGHGAALTTAGVPRINADTFTIHVDGMPSSAPGILFSGTAAHQTPPAFGNGLRCVGGSVTRLVTAFSDATGHLQSDGSLSAAEGLVMGDVRYYQVWYRDMVGPCAAAYNTTGACRVEW